jgi:murein DD-endopeptidase MepM/ murein hydrolase activator NlpD
MKGHATRFATAFLLVFTSLYWTSRPAAAQGSGTNTTPPGGTTVHVVQPGDNLFRIAVQYGTTVEAIAAANGISDPRYITVGQRLLIPNAQVNSPGAIVAYTVRPGDSLATLTRAYNTTLDSLAAANHITNPALLFVGEELTINQSAEDPALPAAAALHRVRPGENLYRIALAYHTPVNTLLKINGLALPTPLYPGQALWIPGGDGTAELSDLPLPFTTCAISPIPAVQGQTISIHITTTGPAALSGTFISYPVRFVTQDATQHHALFGIHTFAASGVYPLELTATELDGTQATLTLRLRVDDGGYASESITLGPDQQDLLMPEVDQPEWQRIATIMSGFTAQRYFDGLMGLPSSGPITSQFGTRRDYNTGALKTFHSGTDFGGGPSTPVLAPAAGVVVLAESLPVRGNATIIDHGWGVYTGYWHQTEIAVTVGQVVTPGQVIGTIGSSGRVTGPHLHWEMWVGGVQVDPLQWVRQSFP